MQIALWERLSPQPPPHIIADWVLSPAEIVRAVQIAPAGPSAVIEACQDNLRGLRRVNLSSQVLSHAPRPRAGVA